MQILKKWGRKEQVLKEEAERELEKVKEQLKVATEEKNKLEQRLKDEEEKSILQNQELEAEEAKNLQLTQQLQSVNAHLEHYRQVCAKVLSKVLTCSLFEFSRTGLTNASLQQNYNAYLVRSFRFKKLPMLLLRILHKSLTIESRQNFSHMFRHSRMATDHSDGFR
jgi:septal ring factor EnvC (AmiA/AmiB activator)